MQHSHAPLAASNEELVRVAIAQQRDAALNALAFAHAEIAMLKAQVEELQQKLANGASGDE